MQLVVSSWSCIQSIKTDYRKRNWLEGAGADPVYFAAAHHRSCTDPSSLLDPNKVFFAAVRMNRAGWWLLPLKYVPGKNSRMPMEKQSGAPVAAAIVPRFLWPDKPKVGGAENLKRFWGINISGYSMNTRPGGWSYGNFGRTRRGLYVLSTGCSSHHFVCDLKLAEKRPTLCFGSLFCFFYAW